MRTLRIDGTVTGRFPCSRFHLGQRVEIIRKDIHALSHRIKKGKVFGIVTGIDGEYHYVTPMWCKWQIELYRGEIRSAN